MAAMGALQHAPNLPKQYDRPAVAGNRLRIARSTTRRLCHTVAPDTDFLGLILSPERTIARPLSPLRYFSYG
jgi:hypothetical protein